MLLAPLRPASGPWDWGLPWPTKDLSLAPSQDGRRGARQEKKNPPPPEKRRWRVCSRRRGVRVLSFLSNALNACQYMSIPSFASILTCHFPPWSHKQLSPLFFLTVESTLKFTFSLLRESAKL
ncbi:Uncharacterized protein HZ326_3452 [Fusarium oxysporum f. sp. albedinis]|nr:Uncharacterized protein HZ326_3452 [Fusarium oxysporum f. sp. albedinis]